MVNHTDAQSARASSSLTEPIMNDIEEHCYICGWPVLEKDIRFLIVFDNQMYPLCARHEHAKIVVYG